MKQISIIFMIIVAIILIGPGWSLAGNGPAGSDQCGANGNGNVNGSEDPGQGPAPSSGDGESEGPEWGEGEPGGGGRGPAPSSGDGDADGPGW